MYVCSYVRISYTGFSSLVHNLVGPITVGASHSRPSDYVLRQPTDPIGTDLDANSLPRWHPVNPHTIPKPTYNCKQQLISHNILTNTHLYSSTKCTWMHCWFTAFFFFITCNRYSIFISNFSTSQYCRTWYLIIILAGTFAVDLRNLDWNRAKSKLQSCLRNHNNKVIV